LSSLSSRDLVIASLLKSISYVTLLVVKSVDKKNCVALLFALDLLPVTRFLVWLEAAQ